MNYRRPNMGDDEINSIFGFHGSTKLNDPNIDQVDLVSSKSVKDFDISNSTQFESNSRPNNHCLKTTDVMWWDFMIDPKIHIASNIPSSSPTKLSSEVFRNETNESFQVDEARLG
jgi:hypothetical protein